MDTNAQLRPVPHESNARGATPHLAPDLPQRATHSHLKSARRPSTVVFRVDDSVHPAIAVSTHSYARALNLEPSYSTDEEAVKATLIQLHKAISAATELSKAEKLAAMARLAGFTLELSEVPSKVREARLLLLLLRLRSGVSLNVRATQALEDLGALLLR